MRKRKRNNTLESGAPLPENIETDKRMCVCLCIPDEPEYRQAFLAQVHSLGKWFHWEKGEPGDDRAKRAAQLWRTILYEDLQMPCGCGDEQAIYRFNEDGELEKSTDGGTTWNPAPEDDPRLTAPEAPPLPGADGSAKKCEAANNVTSHIKAKADDLIADSAAWGNISGLLAGIISLLIFLSVIGTGGVLTPIALGLAGSLLGIGSAAFAAAMTETVYEDFNCILFCYVNPDGTFSPEDVTAIQTEIDAQFTGVAHKFLHDTVGLMGAKGLTNMALTDGVSSTFECDDCGCPVFCGDESLIVSGTMYAQGDGWIEIQAGPDFYGRPGQWIRYGSETVGVNCCTACEITLTSGTVDGAGRQRCNGTNEPFAPVAGDDYIAMEWRMTDSTGRIRLTFLGSPDCP